MLELNKMAYYAPEIPALSITYTSEEIRPLGNNKIVQPNPGTVWDFLTQHDDFKVFKFLVETAQLEYIFNELQANITAFVPSDKNLLAKYPEQMFKNMEKHQALRMINYNTLPRKVLMKELTSSESMKLDTRIRGHVLYTQSSGPNRLVLIGNVGHPAEVIRGDLIVNNGLIHITNVFALPEMS